MNAKEIATVFEEIALLLELKGENPFRVRAFSNAARSLKGLEGSIEEFVEALKKGGVKGFGPQLSENVLTLYETEGLEFYEELRAEFPEGLLELLNIPGLGAKKVKALYEQFGHHQHRTTKGRLHCRFSEHPQGLREKDAREYSLLNRSLRILQH